VSALRHMADSSGNPDRSNKPDPLAWPLGWQYSTHKEYAWAAVCQLLG